MDPHFIERRAHAVECLLNAAGIHDGAERAAIESNLTHFLIKAPEARTDIVYHQGAIFCQRGGKVVSSHCAPTPPTGTLSHHSIWTDGQSISAIDPDDYAQNGTFSMLGCEGLNLGTPGATKKNKDSKSNDSDSHDLSNNNNNNNNG